MIMSGPPRALVVGIGNTDRGDDGMAAAVFARLHEAVPAGVCLLMRSGDLLDLLDKWVGFDTVVLVDAAAPIGRPGRVHRLDLNARPLPVGWSRTSTHAFGLAETVELGRSLDRLPRRLVLYLVEGQQFAPGAPLSPAVSGAVDRVANRIFAEIAVSPASA
jgi:hydrogenase maturation protease